MAEGYARQFGWEAYSAGVSPTPVNPYAVKVMKEIGIDISRQKSSHVDEYVKMKFDYIVTICDHARRTCPVFFGEYKEKLHHPFPDPVDAVGTNEEITEVYRQVRDMIRDWLKYFSKEKLT